MADALGSTERPAYLDPFTEIIGFRGGGRYLVVKLTVFRRILSQAAHNNNVWVIGGGPEPPPLDPDFIKECLISYSLSRSWPWGPGTKYPADPPFDVDPDQGASVASGTITGMPTLPPLTFGAGITGVTGGTIGDSQNQPNVSPGIRFAGVGPGSGGNHPVKPPSFGGRTSNWAGTSAQLELYEFAVASTVGGATLDSALIGFGGVRVTVGAGDKVKRYRAVATAAVPREDGAVALKPPFTGSPVGANANNKAELWVLCQRFSG